MNTIPPSADALFHAYLPDCRRHVCLLRPRYPRCVQTSELLSAAMEGLWRAAQRYQPERGTFWTYACWCIRSSISDYLRTVAPAGARRRRQKGYRHRTVSLPGRLHDNALAANDGEAVPDPAAVLTQEHLELRDELEHCLSRLRPRTRQMVCWYYLEGLTLKEVGRRLGMSESMVSVHLSRLARWLQGRWQVTTRTMHQWSSE